jgi:hypothetical protein
MSLYAVLHVLFVIKREVKCLGFGMCLIRRKSCVYLQVILDEQVALMRLSFASYLTSYSRSECYNLRRFVYCQRENRYGLPCSHFPAICWCNLQEFFASHCSLSSQFTPHDAPGDPSSGRGEPRTTARRRQDRCHTLSRHHLLYHWPSHQRSSLLSGLASLFDHDRWSPQFSQGGK